MAVRTLRHPWHSLIASASTHIGVQAQERLHCLAGTQGKKPFVQAQRPTRDCTSCWRTRDLAVFQARERLLCTDTQETDCVTGTRETLLSCSVPHAGAWGGVRRGASPQTCGPPGKVGGDPPAGNASHGRTPPSNPHDLSGRADLTSPSWLRSGHSWLLPAPD